MSKNILKKIVEITKINNQSILEVGPGTGNLTSYILKNNLEKSLKSQYEKGLKQIEKKELMDILDKEHTFDLPQGILDQECCGSRWKH